MEYLRNLLPLETETLTLVHDATSCLYKCVLETGSPVRSGPVRSALGWDIMTVFIININIIILLYAGCKFRLNCCSDLI